MKTGPAGEKPPALRNSKLVHTFEHRGSRRVVVDSQYFWRYGSKRELIIRYVVERGCVETAELWERFGARTSRVGGFFDTWIKPMVKDGVLRGDGGSVEVAPGWREALERVRTRTDEDRDNRLQSEKYERRRREYHDYLEKKRRGEDTKADPTPALLGKEKVREIVGKMREREVQPALAFVRDTLDRLGSVRLELLSDLWTEHTGRNEGFYLRLALRRLGCRHLRHRSSGEIFVRCPDEWPDDTRDVALEGTPAEVVPMQEGRPAGDWRDHPLDCECDDCCATTPRYVSLRSGATHPPVDPVEAGAVG